jgi:plasmid maintenance system antidote protein VapI
MALRIEKAFGVKMDTLMRMQASYDIAQTRTREKQIHVRRIRKAVHPRKIGVQLASKTPL